MVLNMPIGLGFSTLRHILRVLVLLIAAIIASLHKEFSMTDLDLLNYFMGVFVVRDFSGMFLSQRQYATEILKRAHMVSCNPSRTLVDTESKLGDDGDPSNSIETNTTKCTPNIAKIANWQYYASCYGTTYDLEEARHEVDNGAKKRVRLAAHGSSKLSTKRSTSLNEMTYATWAHDKEGLAVYVSQPEWPVSDYGA
ncbi:ribonuclease H-like domain-containing protein [Tanacetum coccineum]|uniref:Ribonuclease H-like domain-containing protein n=1 Tax=Tanacetum coccineum TaxID=301880 RepID=A0ABQ5AXM8_9ASTR